MVQDEIAAYLSAKGVGTYGSSIFAGSKAQIPSGDGPYLQLTETGGTNPRYVQNHPGPHVQRPTLQILVRAKNYIVARNMIKEAYEALGGVRNHVINGVTYISITTRQEPTDIGQDTTGRVQLVFNIDVEKEPS